MAGSGTDVGRSPGFFSRTFGPAGPMAMTIVWMVAIVLILWVLGFLLALVEIPGLQDLLAFLSSGTAYIALSILFLSYSVYFIKRDRRALLLLAPAAAATLALTVLWLSSGTLQMAPYESLSGVGALAGQLMLPVSLAVLGAGYGVAAIAFFLKRPFFSGKAKEAGAVAPAPAMPAGPQDDERKRMELRGLMKEAERKYLERKIDRETFDKIARGYHEKMTEIDARRNAAGGG